MTEPFQPELSLATVPEIASDEVATLLSGLDGRGWMSARQISAELGWSDRKIRAVANASEGQVISGQSGYRLAREASMDEIQHAAGWLEHQAREMGRRAGQIRSAAHARIGR